jgi:hypothetical protein
LIIKSLLKANYKNKIVVAKKIASKIDSHVLEKEIQILKSLKGNNKFIQYLEKIEQKDLHSQYVSKKKNLFFNFFLIKGEKKLNLFFSHLFNTIQIENPSNKKGNIYFSFYFSKNDIIFHLKNIHFELQLKSK